MFKTAYTTLSSTFNGLAKNAIGYNFTSGSSTNTYTALSVPTFSDGVYRSIYNITFEKAGVYLVSVIIPSQMTRANNSDYIQIALSPSSTGGNIEAEPTYGNSFATIINGSAFQIDSALVGIINANTNNYILYFNLKTSLVSVITSLAIRIQYAKIG